MSIYKFTPVKYNLSTQKDNPIFGDSVTSVEIEDEAGGAFIVLSQNSNVLRFNFDEFYYLAEMVKQMEETYNLHYPDNKDIIE